MPVGDGPWLVVGLGNPGENYAGNRHNAGAMMLEVLAERVGGRFKTHKARADVVEGRLPETLGPGAAGVAGVAGVRVVLAKPRSYMNESGGPVAALRDFFGVPIERIIVAHDELDIDFGAIRVKLGGGDNGHNGLRSITKALGSKEYLRVRIGIGRPPGRMDPAAFVLKDFTGAERKDLGVHLERAADATSGLIAEGLAATQNVFHAG